MQRRGRRCISAAVILPALGLLLYTAVGVLRLTTGRAVGPAGVESPGTECVAWRHTLACSPFGHVARLHSLHCRLWYPRVTPQTLHHGVSWRRGRKQ